MCCRGWGSSAALAGTNRNKKWFHWVNSPEVPSKTSISYKRSIYSQTLFRVKLGFEVSKALSQRRGLPCCPWPKIVTSLILVLLMYASWLPPSIPDTAAFHFCLCQVCAVWFRVLWDEMYHVNINFCFQSISVAIKGPIHPSKYGLQPASSGTQQVHLWNILKFLLEVTQRCSVHQHSGSVALTNKSSPTEELWLFVWVVNLVQCDYISLPRTSRSLS